MDLLANKQNDIFVDLIPSRGVVVNQSLKIIPSYYKYSSDRSIIRKTMFLAGAIEKIIVGIITSWCEKTLKFNRQGLDSS